jgi:hypothetical protein
MAQLRSTANWLGRGLDGSRWITPNHRPFRVNSGQVLVYVKGYRGCSMPQAGMQAWRRANFCTVLSQVRKERIIQCDGESASIKGLPPSAAIPTSRTRGEKRLFSGTFKSQVPYFERSIF